MIDGRPALLAGGHRSRALLSRTPAVTSFLVRQLWRSCRGQMGACHVDSVRRGAEVQLSRQRLYRPATGPRAGPREQRAKAERVGRRVTFDGSGEEWESISSHQRRRHHITNPPGFAYGGQGNRPGGKRKEALRLAGRIRRGAGSSLLRALRPAVLFWMCLVGEIFWFLLL